MLEYQPSIYEWRPELDPLIGDLIRQLRRLGSKEVDLRYCLEKLQAGVPIGAKS